MAFKRKVLYPTVENIDLTTLIQNAINAVIPSGAIMWFNLSSAPSGWRVCNGQNGTPNLIGKYPLGASSNIGASVAAGLPNLYGTFNTDDNLSVDGKLFARGSKGQSFGMSTDNYNGSVVFNASKYNSIYGNSSTVTPPSVKLLPCQKI